MPEDKKKEDKPKKGIAGEDTGDKSRKAIKKAKARGATDASIGKAANRDESTIGQIERGSIKNPPEDLAGNVKKAKSIKKETRHDGFGQMSFNDSMKQAVEHGKNARNRSQS